MVFQILADKPRDTIACAIRTQVDSPLTPRGCAGIFYDDFKLITLIPIDRRVAVLADELEVIVGRIG